MDFPKAARYDRLKFLLAEGLVTSSGPVWQLHRRMLNKGFAAAMYEGFVNVFVAKTKDILNKWKEEDVEEVNFTREIGLLSYSIISKAGFGYDANISGTCSESFGPQAVSLMLDEVNHRLSQPTEYHHYLRPARKRKVDAAIKKADDLIMDIIERRVKEKQEKEGGESAGLDVLLRARDDEKTGAEGSLSPREMRDHIFTFLAAGTETTATTVSWVILELCRHPKVMRRCVGEVDGLKLGKGGDLAYDHVPRMPYLTAVIKESLRLHPPATMVARTNKHDVKLGGYDIPANSNLICSIYSLHHDPHYWPEPEAFLPERFLEGCNSARKLHPFQFLPFSAGPRNCIGQRFALFEIQSCLATMLHGAAFSMTEKALRSYRVEETVVRRPVDMTVQVKARD
jgi:cytochrome P450